MNNALSFFRVFFFLFVFSRLFGIEISLSQKPFVVLITSYNNEKFTKKCILSALNQEYLNYRIIFINDCSSDNTLKILEETVKNHAKVNLVKIIDNQERKLGLRNYYEEIVYHTNDEEIIVCLDGDDVLANDEVLQILNNVYQQKDKEVWLTYGQFKTISNMQKGWNIDIPKKIVFSGDFRKFYMVPTHLRTFYSWLFKKIKKEDLLYQGKKFYEMTWDCAFMFPMLEMCGDRFKFIEKITYLYNDSNPINDHKVNLGLQRFYYKHIQGLRKYKKLNHDIFSKCQQNTCRVCNPLGDVYCD